MEGFLPDANHNNIIESATQQHASAAENNAENNSNSGSSSSNSSSTGSNASLQPQQHSASHDDHDVQTVFVEYPNVKAASVLLVCSHDNFQQQYRMDEAAGK